MCGILGVSTAGGALPSLDAGLLWLQHRGPDDSGWIGVAECGVALGHTRLSIIDLSTAGHQPMATPDGRHVLVYNGEIYNFRELREELLADGEVFVSETDTEVLLKLCVKHGVDALPLLNGIFAFAFLDVRSGDLLLARDGFGVKPLYYAEAPDTVWFSSEMKALTVGQVSGGPMSDAFTELDEVAVARYLTFLWCPGDATPLRGVRKLEPGSALVVRHGSVVRRWAWYKIPKLIADRSMTAGQAVQLVRTRLEEAVNRQLVSDVPLGGFLSGGLDSSSVACFASRRGRSYECFTMLQKGGVDDGETDDLPYAREVADFFKLPLHVVEIEVDRAAHDFRELVWWMGEPLADPAAFNVLYICLEARRRGIKVLLSGTGGDDLFTGYRRHTVEWFARFSDHVPVGLRGVVRRLVDMCIDHRSAGSRKLSKLLRLLELPPSERLVETFVWTGRNDLQSLLVPRLRESIQWNDVCSPMLGHISAMPPGQSPLNSLLSMEQRFFLSDHNLIYTDRLSMAAGVEVRVPFLDSDLVQAAASIPLRFKQNGSFGKWVLREAMRPLLPASVLNRPKSGFGAPLRRWIEGGLAPTLDDLLSCESLQKRGLFDPAGVHALRERNRTGQVDAAYTLFSLAVVEQWCRFHLDGSVGGWTLISGKANG